jgi:hypothetical protein
MKTALFIVAALACAIGSLGCAPKYKRTVFSQTGGGEVSGSVNAELVSVAVGTVVTAQVAPYDSSDAPIPCEVVSQDATTLQVYHASGDRKFAFLGIKEGSTRVEVHANGITVGVIQAQVVAQP